MLAKRPEDRPATAQEIVERIERGTVAFVLAAIAVILAWESWSRGQGAYFLIAVPVSIGAWWWGSKLLTVIRQPAYAGSAVVARAESYHYPLAGERFEPVADPVQE